jgi:nucleoside-triphosphatase THEP1
MVILLIGKSGIGKSCILQKLIATYEDPSLWITTARLPNPSGDGGLGFLATNSFGKARIVSHKTDVQSDIVVGRNHVDVHAVDEMFVPVMKEVATSNDLVAFIDEIGPIELASSVFESLLPEVFGSHNDIVAIIHADDPRLEKYRTMNDALLLTVTLDNRDTLAASLLSIIQKRDDINSLTESQRIFVNKRLAQYVVTSHMMQIKKLLKHAIPYVLEGKIKQLSPEHWAVEGRHGHYSVQIEEGNLACTCDLFNGRNQYQGEAGECSHIQAVQLLQAS